jgi:hypothetical protein
VDASPQGWAAAFPELAGAIDAAIASLGGAVTPKLNWSAPTDAFAASGGAATRLRCTSAQQVLSLLASSRRAAFDLELSSQLAQPSAAAGGDAYAAAGAAAGAGAGHAQAAAAAAPVLVLRRWEELEPAREFRVYVNDHAPVVVCQRDPCRYFPELQAPGVQLALRDTVCAFHARHFGGGFPRGACECCMAPVCARAGGRAGARTMLLEQSRGTCRHIGLLWARLPVLQTAPPRGARGRRRNCAADATACSSLARRRP